MARDVEMYDENILLDYPPDHVTIGDTEYRIRYYYKKGDLGWPLSGGNI